MFLKYPNVNYNNLVIDFLDEKDFMVKVQSFFHNKKLHLHGRLLKRLEENHNKRKIALVYKLYITLREVLF